VSEPLFSIGKRAEPRRARAVGRAEPTSDVRRPRRMLVVAIVAAIAVAIALVAAPPSAGLASPGPLARPHAAAKIACAKCHAEGAPQRACGGCHGDHKSARPAHAALMSKGDLGCATCHPSHGAPQGVTFAANGSFVRWGGTEERAGFVTQRVPAKTTVPLVALAACEKCHDATRAGDPIAACTAPGARVSTCFDEHRHSEARFVAWEAAADAARQVPWIAPRDERRLPWTWLGAATSAALIAALAIHVRRRPRAVTVATPAPRVRLPTIDTSTCLGCYACVDACPFDVIAVERYVAVVARPDDCCGATLCQSVCPNGSLVMSDGGEAGQRARVDEHLEALDAPGVFLAGDLTGMPLIKNAIAQGTRTIDRIAATLKRTRIDAEVVDVLVVGAGPAGLSALLRAQERSLSALALEQASIASSVRSFPRGKLVYDPPLDLPVEGELWLREATKEELLAQWTRIVRARRLDVRERHEVRAIDRAEDIFVVHAATPEGERTFRARRVLLAIGRRGTPRRFDAHVARDAEAKVSYALADARSYERQRVLVVGLGDSAMEAACALARQPGTEVTVSYRGSGFARGKARNIAEVKSLVAKCRVRIVFDSAVERVDAKSVVLRTKSGARTIANDAVLALIGGTPSWSLVGAAGVKTTTPSSPEVGPPNAPPIGPVMEVSDDAVDS